MGKPAPLAAIHKAVEPYRVQKSTDTISWEWLFRKVFQVWEGDARVG